jgi:hypothetical protein
MAKATGGGKLHRLPFRTFGEIAALGFEIEVHCSSCYRQTKVAPADRHLYNRVFAAAPFRCSNMRDHGFAVPLQPCRAPRFVYIKPAVLLPVGGEVTLIFLSCSRCVPPWFIEYMPADRPPWLRAGWGPDDRYRCPACRGSIDWRFHGPTWRPTGSSIVAPDRGPRPASNATG